MISFNNIAELVALAEKESRPIHEFVIEREIQTSSKTREQVIAGMERNWEVMKQSVEHGITNTGKSVSGLTGGDAVKMYAYSKTESYLGKAASAAASYAIGIAEVNATMGKIVACPTAGSCGIVPAALYAAMTQHQKTDEAIVKSLFTAAGIGMVIDQNACIAGATGGCQAECGTAAGMAAGALVELAGGTPSQVGQAVAFAIKNLLGLVCDPVAGLVEVPCVKRNGFEVVHSMVAADMALAGIESVIPVDEVIDAMYKIGRSMPKSLRETAKGGLAVTPTGLRLSKQIYGDK